MSTLYESIKALCDAKGIKPGKMCVDLDLSKSMMTKLKNGTKQSIQIETAQKIAGYFGVSIDRVLGESDTKEKVGTAGELSAVDAELVELFNSAPEWKRKAALALLRAAEEK